MTIANIARLTPIFKGLLTWVPGVQRAFYTGDGGGATASAKYCYGVWLKHLSLLWQSGMRAMPRTVLELGPGDSLGTGLAALLSGAERYGGVDVVRHASVRTTRPVLRELTALFQARSPRPTKGWPDFDDCLDQRLFPGSALTEDALARALAPERIARIAQAVERLDSRPQHPMVRYATWREPEPIGEGEADLIFSHVVLCVVDDVERMYRNCARWLKPGGWMSHQTDFTSLGVTKEWNGHLQYTEAQWSAIAGRRPFFANRERLSTHLELLDKHGFDVVSQLRQYPGGGIGRSQLAPRWQGISDDDLNCARIFLVARKRG
jgi:SAM-dependent methyltransferase